MSLKKEVKLQEHQTSALDKLDATDAILLYHGLGSGKTLSSIAATQNDKTTVVVPASLRSNYIKELDKFTDKSDHNIISYEGALADKEGVADSLVVDEIHRIANANSGRSKKIREMAKYYDKRIGLTGTPIVNHPSELAPIMQFLNPYNRNIPVDRKEFNKKFLSDKKHKVNFFQALKGVKPGVTTEVINEDVLRKAIKGKVHYYDMGTENYPKVTEEVVKVPMSKEQVDIYNTVVKQANPAIAYKVRKNMPLSKGEMSKMNFFMSAARQTSNTTGKFGGSESATPKIERVVSDFVAEFDKDKDFKGLIYSNYIGSGLDIIDEKLKENGVKTLKFTGKLTDKAKKSAVEKFNSGKANALLISSAGAEGLDLKGTNMVQVVEPHWNKARIDQVIGRAARFKSHSHLPKSKQVVAVKKYQSTRPKRWYNQNPGTSADEYLESMSEDKAKLNNIFLDILKEEGLK